MHSKPAVSEPLWLRLARQEIGVTEIRGRASNQRIIEYGRDAKVSNYSNDDIPWCAVFVCAILERAGIRSTQSALARSFSKWGVEVDEPAIGAIAVLTRGNSSWQGHVGFIVGWDDRYLHILGGNQRNAVNIQKYRRSRLIRLCVPGAEDYYDNPLPELDVDPEPLDWWDIEEPQPDVSHWPDLDSASSTSIPALEPEYFEDTTERLRKEGSRIVKGADDIEKVVQRSLFGTVAMWVANQVTNFTPTPDNVREWIEFLTEFGVVILVIFLALFVVDRTGLIKFARTDDERSGATQKIRSGK